MQQSGYTAAAVCRRGHVETTIISQRERVADRCAECGAVVLSACPSCGYRIKGVYFSPHVLSLGQTYTPPNFCDQCGSPYPWVGRQARIYELQNLLDEEHLDAATELTVREQLEALADPDLEEAEQLKRWKRVKSAAPDFLLKAATQPIVTSLVTAYAKNELGLPPN